MLKSCIRDTLFTLRNSEKYDLIIGHRSHDEPLCVISGHCLVSYSFVHGFRYKSGGFGVTDMIRLRVTTDIHFQPISLHSVKPNHPDQRFVATR